MSSRHFLGCVASLLLLSAGWAETPSAEPSGETERTTIVPVGDDWLRLRHTPGPGHWLLPPPKETAESIDLPGRAFFEVDRPCVSAGHLLAPGVYRVGLQRDPVGDLGFVFEALYRSQPPVVWRSTMGELDRPVSGVELAVSAWSTERETQGVLQLRWRALVAEARFECLPGAPRVTDGWEGIAWDDLPLPKNGQDQPVGWLAHDSGSQYLATIRRRPDGWRLELTPVAERRLRREEQRLRREIEASDPGTPDRDRSELELRAIRHRLARVLAEAMHTKGERLDGRTPNAGTRSAEWLKTRQGAPPRLEVATDTGVIAFELPVDSGPRPSAAEDE